MILGLVLFFLFLIIILSLIYVRIRDSAGKYNNSLLIYYFGVSLWLCGGLGGIYTQITSDTSQTNNSKASKNKKYNEHYDLILYGLVLLSAVYIIRRPEWAGMIIDGIAAWKGKDLDRSKEMLIQHAILNPKDRKWIQAFLVDIETKRIEKEVSNEQEEKEEPR